MDTYETHAKGIRILPGQWRPHYPFEQIAWISPPWPSQDYLWLDFPEAIFCDAGLLYLSHVSPAFPVIFPDLPRAPWRSEPDELSFRRLLPNGVEFGGSIREEAESVALELTIRNGSDVPLRDLKLQTCAYLRAIDEFAARTQANKYVHLPGGGWTPLDAALARGSEGGRYRLGWRRGPMAADLPLIATTSSDSERLVALTWHAHTNSLIGNPAHPCMHADPFFLDLEPGQESCIRGDLIFFEGSLAAFGEWFPRFSAERS